MSLNLSFFIGKVGAPPTSRVVVKDRNNVRKEPNKMKHSRSSIKQAIYIMDICIMNDIGVCLRIDSVLVFTEPVSSLSLSPLLITLRLHSKI